MTGPNDQTSAVIDSVAQALSPSGIHVRGVVLFSQAEGPGLQDGGSARSVLLLGQVGGSIWPSFTAWRQCHAGAHPLDAWSKAMILPVATMLGATAYFPSDEPWQPFQRWAMEANGLRPSPLGILIHPQFGLWHGYRGALGFAEELAVPDAMEPDASQVRHACDSCMSKPCLSACPAGAVTAAGFNLTACRSLLSTPGGAACMEEGCLARNACPVGRNYRYPDEQLRFHMQALGTERANTDVVL